MPIKLGAKSAEPDVMMIHALGQFVSAGWAEPLDAYLCRQEHCSMRPGTIRTTSSPWHATSRPRQMAELFDVDHRGSRRRCFNKAMLGEAGLAVRRDDGRASRYGTEAQDRHP
jgi:multiple sugar transport system substrate-binding protein